MKQPVSPRDLLVVTAHAAAVAVLAMLLIFVVTGIGQDPLQSVHASEDYAHLLLARPPVLRAVVGIDNLFIVFYVTAFLCAGMLLMESGANRTFTLAGVLAICATGALDLFENLHFLVMLGQAELGLSISPARIAFQVLESLVKFHVSYLGLFLFGAALLGRTRAERTLARLAWYVQLPVGLLIYVTPHAIALPLVFVRFAFFLTGLVLLPRIFASGSDAPVSLRGTTPSVAD